MDHRINDTDKCTKDFHNDVGVFRKQNRSTLTKAIVPGTSRYLEGLIFCLVMTVVTFSLLLVNQKGKSPLVDSFVLKCLYNKYKSICVSLSPV